MKANLFLILTSCSRALHCDLNKELCLKNLKLSNFDLLYYFYYFYFHLCTYFKTLTKLSTILAFLEKLNSEFSNNLQLAEDASVLENKNTLPN